MLLMARDCGCNGGPCVLSPAPSPAAVPSSPSGSCPSPLLYGAALCTGGAFASRGESLPLRLRSYERRSLTGARAMSSSRCRLPREVPRFTALSHDEEARATHPSPASGRTPVAGCDDEARRDHEEGNARPRRTRRLPHGNDARAEQNRVPSASRPSVLHASSSLPPHRGRRRRRRRDPTMGRLS